MDFGAKAEYFIQVIFGVLCLPYVYQWRCESDGEAILTTFKSMLDTRGSTMIYQEQPRLELVKFN
jgi:hypothetical protein